MSGALGNVRVPGVEVSGALGNVWSYELGDYEVVYYCVIHSSWEVGGERGVFFLIFVCGGVRGGVEAVICYDNSMVIEEI